MSFASLSRAGLAEAAAPAAQRTIPFDYGFRFLVQEEAGAPRARFVGRTLSATVDVSIEADFTAVAIGYGLIPEIRQRPFGPGVIGDLREPSQPGQVAPAPAALVAPGLPGAAAAPPRPLAVAGRRVIELPDALKKEVQQAAADHGALLGLRARVLKAIADRTTDRDGTSLADLPADARNALTGTPGRLTVGDLIRCLARVVGEEDFSRRGEIGPETEAELLNGIRLNPGVARLLLVTDQEVFLGPELLAQMFETLPRAPERVQFLYGLHDQGTGREFQSEPLLNIAGLGAADGTRPFRRLAQPITFAARSTIRMDVIPRSEFRGELQIVLHGFKVLGGAGTPTGPRRRRRGLRGR